MSESALTAGRLRELLDYNPETGVFRWRASRGGPARKGTVAGRIWVSKVDHHRYWRITVCREEHRAHRLAWLWVTGEWPSEHIDHADGDGLNNRWQNLRLASPSQNSANCGPRKRNVLGVKGVHIHKETGRYRAQIRVGGRSLHLGLFETLGQAAAAYAEAAKEHYGEFARME